jgi:DNA polymerase III subunit alpha
MSDFVHLRLHSEYSLVDGLVRVGPLVERVADLGMGAVALTDLCNFYGLVKFSKAAFAAGVKPIFGADLLVVDREDEDDTSALTLLVMDGTGYRNLTELISLAYTRGQRLAVPRVTRAWLDAHAEGLIALSAGATGDVGRALDRKSVV